MHRQVWCAAKDVSLCVGVAPQFTADGAGAAPEQLDEEALAVALLHQRDEGDAFFVLQLCSSGAHPCNLPDGMVLHFGYEAATSIKLKETKCPTLHYGKNSRLHLAL